MKTLLGTIILALAVSCTCGHNDGLCEYDAISVNTGKKVDHFRRSCRASFTKDGIYYKNLSAGN